MEKYEYLLLKAISGPHFFTNEDLRMNKKINILLNSQELREFLAFKDNLVYTSGETMNRISQDQIIVDNVKKNLVKVRSVNGDMVYTREDYESFIHHFEMIIKELNYEWVKYARISWIFKES